MSACFLLPACGAGGEGTQDPTQHGAGGAGGPGSDSVTGPDSGSMDGARPADHGFSFETGAPTLDAGWGETEDGGLAWRDPYAPPDELGPPGLYAEALQKVLYFYDAEKSGFGITGGRLEWRGNSETRDAVIPLVPCDQGAATNCVDMSQSYIDRYRHIFDPDGIDTIDLVGGFHDAGDHVKFGLPQAYAASTLAWGFYEFVGAFIESGQAHHMLEILRWFGDYFLRCTFRDGDGEVIAFAHQVGNGDIDHAYWGPPELARSCERIGDGCVVRNDPAKGFVPRPAYFATHETPSADVTAQAAAALALLSLVFRPTDPVYADICLEHAGALYRFAAQYPSLTATNGPGGYYTSRESEDDLAWAAVWLHEATSDGQYLDDITRIEGGRYTGWLGRIMAAEKDGWSNAWTHCWDVVWAGMFVRLSQAIDNDKIDKIARWNLSYWSGGEVPHLEPGDTQFIATTPGGLSYLAGWGSNRYNAAAQLAALVWAKHTGETGFAEWAKGQMDYIFGDNPLDRSYIVGFLGHGSHWPVHPHHRAAHGGTTDNSMDVPPENMHTLWGALVGGPDESDYHEDVIQNFVLNEVTIDYNAALVGALAGLYTYYGWGQGPLPDFPPLETRADEFWASASVGSEGEDRSQIRIVLNNESVHPPHFDRHLSVRYYFDISELLAANQTVQDAFVDIVYDERAGTYDQLPTTITQPQAADEARGLYYVEIGWEGFEFYGPIEVEIQVSAGQDPTWRYHYDPSNDWSRQGLTEELTRTPYIPVYRNGELVFGQEPS